VSDAVAELAQTEGFCGLVIDGEYHDTGNPRAYLETLIELSLKDPAHGAELREFLQRKLAE
jgi:UTP--glucose-1-phosphate uridylyltransferase